MHPCCVLFLLVNIIEGQDLAFLVKQSQSWGKKEKEVCRKEGRGKFGSFLFVCLKELYGRKTVRAYLLWSNRTLPVPGPSLQPLSFHLNLYGVRVPPAMLIKESCGIRQIEFMSFGFGNEQVREGGLKRVA